MNFTQGKSSRNNRRVSRQTLSGVVYVWFCLALIIPNILLCFSEHLPFWASVANIALPAGVIGLILSSSRRIGISIWILFPLVLLAAFQIVLLKLYGSGVIAVDMFLNVTTTNTTEAGELLSSLWPTILLMALVYIPPLVYAAITLKKKLRFKTPLLKHARLISLSVAVIGALSATGSYIKSDGYAISSDLYPFNAGYNMWLAIERTSKTKEYPSTSANYDYEATSVHDNKEREVLVLVIGETSRADHWGLFGYNRNTNPLLSKRSGLIIMPETFSESNTTHKSVPMLLSPVNSTNFDTDIYKVKSLLSAFKQAGYHTWFVSNQAHNHSFIDYFSSEADESLFPDGSANGKGNYDTDLLAKVEQILKHKDLHKLIVVHSYGSHFNYSDRYTDKDRLYKPDNCADASLSNRKCLINAYDNTIVATDRFLDSLIEILQHENCTASLLYTSDHGEDLYDDGVRFLHASPVPTIHQLHVPMLAWTSERYDSLYPDILSVMRNNAEKRISSSSSYCATAFSLGGVSTPRIDISRSVADSSYKSQALTYLTDRNKSVYLAEILNN